MRTATASAPVRSDRGGKPVETRKLMMNEGETSADSGYLKGVNDA